MLLVQIPVQQQQVAVQQVQYVPGYAQPAGVIVVSRSSFACALSCSAAWHGAWRLSDSNAAWPRHADDGYAAGAADGHASGHGDAAARNEHG